MSKKVYFIILSILLLGCSNSNKHNVAFNGNSILIDNELSEVKDVIFYKDIFKDYKAIKLETNENCLIGKIHQIEMYKDKFYIADKTTAKGLYVFNKDGSFERKIGQLGKGPGEYLDITSFSINPEKSQINIYDRRKKVLNIYDLNGNYIETVKFSKKRMIGDAIKLNDDIYIDYLDFKSSPVDYWLEKRNDDGITNYFPTESFGNNYQQLLVLKSPFIRVNNGYKYTKMFFDEIYSIQDDSIKLDLKLLNVNKPSSDEMDRINQSKDAFKVLRCYAKSEKFFGIEQYFENKRLVYLIYKENMKNKIVIYDKMDKKYIVANKIEDDMTKLDKALIFIGANNNCFIKYLTCDDAAYADIVNNQGEVSDNPVILIYTTK